MLILLFAIVCAAGVVFLFWQLKDSDRVTADRLRISLGEEAGAGHARP
jgi:hypothetical protein